MTVTVSRPKAGNNLLTLTDCRLGETSPADVAYTAADMELFGPHSGLIDATGHIPLGQLYGFKRRVDASGDERVRSARMEAGSTEVHAELEATVATFLEKPAAIVIGMGFATSAFVIVTRCPAGIISLFSCIHSSIRTSILFLCTISVDRA